MWPNPQETADLVTFTKEILNVKFHFLCSVNLVFWKFISLPSEQLNSKNSYNFYESFNLRRLQCMDIFIWIFLSFWFTFEW